MDTGMDIGIDLGTTFSVIAVNGRVELATDYPPGIYLDQCDVTVIPTPDGDPTFPSVVLEDPDDSERYIFGHEALQRAEEGYAPAMFSKRKIGTKETIPMLTRTVVAKDVAREFLRYLKLCAERALGCAVQRAVVTHPAYFDRGAVEETREAAIEAGFEMSLPEQMLMEPVAAALAYTRTDKRDPLRILTYDLGGGTFDVTYLERRSGVIDMRAFDGDHLLGGYNFDRELAHWVRTRLEAQGRRIVLDENDPVDRGRLARLLRLAESVKIALAEAEADTKPVEVRGRGILADISGKDIQIQERLTREQFVALIQPHLDRTVECCRHALQKAGADPAEVDEVLMVGGSTYGPWVKSSLSSAFPSTTPKLFHPDLCVGAGAAIHAKLALPPLIIGAKYRLILDVPERAVLDVIAITGQVAAADGTPVTESLSAKLRLPDANDLGPGRLTKDGRFLFDDVELRDDRPNQFTLTITDAGGTTIFDRHFQVVYSPDDTETSAVTTVLPKPLYISTTGGPVPLAAEGARLPAQYQGTFERTNDNPNMSIQLFQERDPIGEVRIEGIPAEGGSGSYVDLQLEITEKNQVRGQAAVRTRDNKVVARSNVSVYFDVPEIQSAEELRADFALRQEQWLARLLNGEEDENAGMRLIEHIQRLFEQQPLERQEIYVALRQLANLLTPPEDKMNPTRDEFLEVVETCRDAIGKMVAKAESMLTGSQSTPLTGGFDQTMINQAQSTLRKAKHFQQVVTECESKGLAAHEKRDRRTWATVFSTLMDIMRQVKDRPKAEMWDTPTAKISLILQAMFEVARLNEGQRALERQGALQDWVQEVKKIRDGLNAVIAEAHNVDDALPQDQGLTQLRLLHSRKLQPLIEAIDRLQQGTVIRKI